MVNSKIKIVDFGLGNFKQRIMTGDDKWTITYDIFNECKQLYKNKLSQEDSEIVDIISYKLKTDDKMPWEVDNSEKHFLKNNPIELWCEYLIFRYKLRVYPSLKKVIDFPVYLLIEPVSACNLRCVMCFQVDKTFTKKPYMGMMKLDLFKKIIDEAVDGGTKAITLASRGEPTMHKKLGEMLDYASGKFFEIKLNTNGTILTEKLCHTILSTGVNSLVWSIDAPKKELYEQIRVRGNFDEVIDNIKMFNEIKEKYYSDSPILTTASGVMFREDQDVDEFNNFFKKIADQVALQPCEERWDTYFNEVHPDINSPCMYLWERMYIWFDGICNPCDVDYKSYLETGNINEKSIKEVWHGETYTKLRDDHLSDKRSNWTPCDRCGIH